MKFFEKQVNKIYNSKCHELLRKPLRASKTLGLQGPQDLRPLVLST